MTRIFTDKTRQNSRKEAQEAQNEGNVFRFSFPSVLDNAVFRAKVDGIMTLTEIKEEIPLLTLSERLKLIRWLATDAGVEDGKAEADAWDTQIRKDMKAGRLDFLFEEADAEYVRGETEEWP